MKKILGKDGKPIKMHLMMKMERFLRDAVGAEDALKVTKAIYAADPTDEFWKMMVQVAIESHEMVTNRNKKEN